MLLRGALVVLGLSLLASQGALAQRTAERPPPNGGTVVARTPPGQADLQGVWSYATATPLQRFGEFSDRPFISDEEAARWVAKMLQTRSADIRDKNAAVDLWWERDTLVVETVNFRTGANLRGFGVAPGMGVATGPDFHLIERFSLTGPDALLYEFTVTNPKFFSQPCTVREPMARSKDRMFEAACHEGNSGLEFILRGARAEEKERQSKE